MPRKIGRRRGHGWSRLRTGRPTPTTNKRKRDNEFDEDPQEDQPLETTLAIGTENEERWRKMRENLGFRDDTAFVTYLLDLAERKGIQGNVMHLSKQEENKRTHPSTATGIATDIDEPSKEPEDRQQDEDSKSLTDDQMPLIMECEEHS